MSWDQLDHMLSKFNFSFNWEYCGDLELRSILNDVFRILEEDDERSLEQILIGCVHQASPGLTLNQPKSNPSLPHELKFIVHPPLEDFCITKLIILSEARNLELYINGGYEKSSRGIMLTLNKGRKLSLFEASFDLSNHVNTVSNATIKFLSFPCKNHMKIQAVVMKVDKCQPITRYNGEQVSGPIDLVSVKRFLGSVGRPLSSDAQKMLQSIENYQKSPAFKAQQMLSSQAALLQNVAKRAEQSTSDKDVKQKKVKEEKDVACNEASQPEQDKLFMKMLAELSLRENHAAPDHSTEATSSLPQSRWAAYLQSRLRASKVSPESLHGSVRPAFAEECLGLSEDLLHQATPRQRPNSVGCVDGGELDRTFNLEMLRQRRIQDARDSRCKTCGCPGCLSVYNSVTTSIFAAEERILAKVDKKFARLQEDMNKQFETLFQLLGNTQKKQDEKLKNNRQ